MKANNIGKATTAINRCKELDSYRKGLLKIASRLKQAVDKIEVNITGGGATTVKLKLTLLTQGELNRLSSIFVSQAEDIESMIEDIKLPE